METSRAHGTVIVEIIELTEDAVKFFDRIARHVERLDIKKQTDILNKGDKALGIFIVVRGEAEVVSQNGKDVIATISEGDYFGEISVLFKVPCTARVRVPQKAILLFLPVEKANKVLHRVQIELQEYYKLRKYMHLDADTRVDQTILQTEIAKEALKQVRKAILLFLPVEKANKVLHRVQIELQEYYKLRKYMHLDADTRVDQTILQTEIAKEALKQVPMLESWSDESLSYIISNIAKLHNPIVLYPTNSCLIHQKDPSREICILVRGKVSVVDGKKVITTIDTKKSPICVGEEGLFTNTDRAVTFKTLTVCHVIKIDKAALIETIHKFEWMQEHIILDLWTPG
uniref:Uncharacterized protein LOC102801930 n=1 Tax=Saccoglossus kowalevskii TaxID=10224 RepID=A0ABM0MYZ7_SACKO|nr:PREDICTED: uncharacterized protein LOC102801930 [Saccoglossus kowalevskii]